MNKLHCTGNVVLDGVQFLFDITGAYKVAVTFQQATHDIGLFCQIGDECRHKVMVMVMVMNLYSAFSITIFKCALQARDLWVRSDISIYGRRWQPLSVH